MFQCSKFGAIILRASVLVLWTLSANELNASEDSTAQTFKQLRNSPLELRHFLLHMPKGADLHNHLVSSSYAEVLIGWAAEDGKCVDLNTYQVTLQPCSKEDNRPPVQEIRFSADIVNKIIDAFSMRNYERRSVSGHNHFFATFARFTPATVGREGDLLAAVAAQASKQNILYLELMQSEGMEGAMILADKIDLTMPVDQLLNGPELNQLAANTLAKLDDIEERQRELMDCQNKCAGPGCEVKVRYLAQVIRTVPPNQVYAQTLLAAKLIDSDPRYVGLNFVAPEDDPITLRDYTQQMHFIEAATKLLSKEKRQISLHAGELTINLVPPEYLGVHIREAIEIAGAKRIGHGIDIGYDPRFPELMQRMATENIAVEINLTSNDITLGVSGDRHPLQTYRKFGVPITLNTDGAGVSRIDLTNEYQRIVESYDFEYAEIKELSRNGLAYSFLPGEGLFTLPVSGQMVSECTNSEPGVRVPSADCQKYLDTNEKADLQWQLEVQFHKFESKY